MNKDMENHSFGPLHPLGANHSTLCWGLMMNEKQSVPTPRTGSLGGLVSELGLHQANSHGANVVLRSPLKDKIKEILIIL